MCCFLNTWNLQLYKVLDPTAPFILLNWKHCAHLNKRDDCKLNWLFSQCLKKPLIKFRVATLKVFLPYRGMVSVIKLARSKETLSKNEWRANLTRCTYLGSAINFFSDTSFPITSNTENNNNKKHLRYVKIERNLIICELSSPCPCIPKDGYLWNLLGTW